MVTSRSSSFLIISAAAEEEKHTEVTPSLVDTFTNAAKFLLTALCLSAVPLGAAFVELPLELLGLGFGLIRLVLVETAHLLCRGLGQRDMVT